MLMRSGTFRSACAWSTSGAPARKTVKHPVIAIRIRPFPFPFDFVENGAGQAEPSTRYLCRDPNLPGTGRKRSPTFFVLAQIQLRKPSFILFIALPLPCQHIFMRSSRVTHAARMPTIEALWIVERSLHGR